MTLTAVVSHSPESILRYREVAEKLTEVLGHYPKESDLGDVHRDYGYAHYIATGTVPTELIDKLGRTPTELEISMMVDGGYSHFGGYCTLNPVTDDFTCKIHTD